MNIVLKNAEQAISVVKRMVYLAYEACGAPMGMGVFQAVSDADEDRVWKNAYNAEDYPARPGRANNEVYGDYVFGRMMKWGCKWNGNTITIPDRKFRPDYQSFCLTYPDNKTLLSAALDSLNIKDAKFDENEVAIKQS